MALVGRLLESHGFRVGILDQPDWRTRRRVPRARSTESVLGRDRRQHGLDGQSLHERPQDPQRRRVLARRRRRVCAPIARCSSTRSAAAKRSRDVPLVDRRHRGEPAPHRALRLLVRQGPPLDARRHAAPICSSTATPSARSSRSRTASRPARRSTEIRDLRGTAHLTRAGSRTSRELDSTSLDAPGRVEPMPDPYAMEAAREAAAAVLDRRGRARRRQADPARAASASIARTQVIRMPSFEQVIAGSGALRARVAHPAPRERTRERARARAAPRQASTSGSTRRRCR